MRSWPTLDLPAVTGSGLPLRLRDTGSGELRTITGRDGTVRLYVCGITPYDATHLGHAATYVTFDIVVRALIDGGLRVRYVQNVTDVDEPLLERAARDGIDWTDLAQMEIALFREDMTALAVLPPDELVGVVESIDVIAASVRDLIERGFAYEVRSPDADPDVYLDLASIDAFGRVSGWSRAHMAEVFVERGGDPEREGKRDPFDPLLWRAAREGEPSWSVAGLPRGRPGWHIECTAIAADRLGLPLDIQGGGTDLIFPHHEMSATQAAALDQIFAGAYVHQAMVGLDGAKMSKSKGNLVLVSTLRADGVHPMAIRLLLLDRRYDAEWDYHPGDLEEAATRLALWHEALSVNAAPTAQDTVDGIRLALADNLDTRTALAHVDAWARMTLNANETLDEAPGDLDPGAPGVLGRALDALLGIRL